jgi:hypothetical protein
MEAQSAAFDASPARQRDLDHFRARIDGVGSAAELVADRRLLSVALGAFGLGDDIDNAYFVRKVLEEGARDRDALANRLTDGRYREFSAAFGFGDGTLPGTGLAGFAEEIASGYLRREFEAAVGASDQTMRLALTLERALPEITARPVSDETKWLTVLGTPPLRLVFETAMGLPRSFGALDLDRQVAEMQGRAARMFGTSDFGDFGDPAKQEDLLRDFLARAQIAGGFGGDRTGVASPALTLLSQAAGPMRALLLGM